jgi:hypothetical protein
MDERSRSAWGETESVPPGQKKKDHPCRRVVFFLAVASPGETRPTFPLHGVAHCRLGGKRRWSNSCPPGANLALGFRVDPGLEIVTYCNPQRNEAYINRYQLNSRKEEDGQALTACSFQRREGGPSLRRPLKSQFSSFAVPSSKDSERIRQQIKKAHNINHC